VQELDAILTDARRCLAAGDADGAWRWLRVLLHHGAVRSFHLETVGRLLAEWSGPLPTTVRAVRLALVGTYTTEPLAHALRCAACREGVFARVYEAPFGALEAEILNPASGLYREPCDLVVLALNAAALTHLPPAAADAEAVAAAVRDQVAHFQLLWSTLQARLACPVLQHVPEPRGRSYIGPAERAWPAGPDAWVSAVSAGCFAAAPPAVHWLDTAGLAQNVGLEQWFDDRLYFHGKYGFNPRFLDRYADLLGGMLRVVFGRTKKCLVTDLDNTLWGGVVGDDGWAGVALGPETAAGEAHQAFCSYLRDLSRRGVMLAVCSKNDPAFAREVFTRHPAMPLRVADFAAFHCSWQDKVTGLRTLASELNIALEHMAFVDDNLAECELIRQQLPDVSVLSLDGDPSTFIARVERRHWFDVGVVTGEDRLRAASYLGRNQAAALRSVATDLPTYLTSLDMHARCAVAQAVDRPRLAQMEMKTNQFNLTTRRYDEAQLAELQARPDVRVLACWLRDRFADHGLVASAILVGEGPDWRIDSWLMSCRVFSRTLEQAMLNVMAAQARQAGARRLVGQYLPTDRNGVVKDLFAQLGFTCEPGPGPEPRWVLPLDPPPALPTFVTLADEATPVS
jgi:FkbH-like protein